MREDLELEYLGLCGGTTTQQRATSSPTLEQGEFSILTALMDFPNIIVGVTKYVGLEEVKLWTLETELILTHTSRVLDLWMEGLFAIEWAGDADKRVPQRERETDLAFHAYRAAALASSQAEHDRELEEEIIDKISRRAKGQAVWNSADHTGGGSRIRGIQISAASQFSNGT